MRPLTVQPDSDARGRLLLTVARGAVESALGRAAPAGPDPAWMREVGATFVTLRWRGELRGCIGTLHAHRPLGDDVRQNAVAAAFHDPRFLPLEAFELPELRVEVSLLSQLEPLPFTNREELLRVLRPGEDGVVLQAGPYRGTFLPQVWEELPTPELFLRNLEAKAGLPEHFWTEFWPDQIHVWRYGVLKWAEG